MDDRQLALFDQPAAPPHWTPPADADRALRRHFARGGGPPVAYHSTLGLMKGRDVGLDPKAIEAELQAVIVPYTEMHATFVGAVWGLLKRGDGERGRPGVLVFGWRGRRETTNKCRAFWDAEALRLGPWEAGL